MRPFIEIPFTEQLKKELLRFQKGLITLIRRASFRDRSALEIAKPPKGSMLAEHISLMRSERGKHGMIYTEISLACPPTPFL